ncbi:hypothetical protein G6F56_012492 [Rhizopus delemar]|nr:hypothetical protein G6F56_012492 [Rhizopus delemar]
MLEEHDAFYFQDSTLGTRIKRAALHIFKSWKNGMELTDMQRYWMKCGLSSILDLVNPKHRITHPSLPDIFDQTYDVVAALLEKHNDIEKAINYIRLVKTSSTETKKKLNVISTVIHILESNAFLLNPDNLHRVTEYDFITQIWSPLLKSIIDVHGILRLKIGESSPCHGTMSRKRIYQQVNVGFKVDIRILYDSRHNEHDLLASEVAKAGSSSKINASPE